jgi:hypothetical protein
MAPLLLGSTMFASCHWLFRQKRTWRSVHDFPCRPVAQEGPERRPRRNIVVYLPLPGADLILENAGGMQSGFSRFLHWDMGYTLPQK